MNSSTLLGITTFTYLLSTLLYVAVVVFKAPKIGKVATIFTALAWLSPNSGSSCCAGLNPTRWGSAMPR